MNFNWRSSEDWMALALVVGTFGAFMLMLAVIVAFSWSVTR